MSALLRHSFIRFLIVGLLNTLVGLGISFFSFNLLQFNYWASTFLGNTTGAVVSYVLNKKFTFRSQISIRSSWWRFVLVILSCYGVSYGASIGLAQACIRYFPQVPAGWLHNGAIFMGNVLYTISNYLGHKHFTFRSSISKKAGNPMNGEAGVTERSTM
ncbi:GtrA family protein [Paenibacillus filicis]|uniref:GtrA family protein n=1 Tax=Paenibacillus gyeongsangnamensis TaxID=3388067 RepID=A0ABT4QBF7_9BACL|nr:GtrA family protein [Paenibacillus filicis]MCZ8514227.1 GtrA family protein [Paenibacillus filicis]